MHPTLPLRLAVALAALTLTASTLASAANYSELWGKNGEKWTPESRLPDFSYAGYHRGEKPIPDVPVVLNVRDFGAVGDGEHDDSQAFLDAIAACDGGAILIPEGRYRITEILEIRKSNVVLRGEGPERTVLYFPKPLNDILPNWGDTSTGRRTSNYSWSGGFIRVKGDFQSKPLAGVTEPAERGARSVTVSTGDAGQLAIGQEVEIYQEGDEEDRSLFQYIYSGDPGDLSKAPVAEISQVVRIRQIDGGSVHFDRPLRFDVRLQWRPQIRHYEPTVTEVGIENLGFEFPVKPYGGHFTELGFNAGTLLHVDNCWVRNIRVLNCDSGFFINANFSTLANITFDTERTPSERNMTGHHGYTFHGSDNLLTGFAIKQRFIHDITLSLNAVGNVISDGYGVDLALDHHKRGPYENLFTNINAGAGTRVWRSGGGAALGKHCAARGTFWNIRADQSIPYPPETFGPVSINIVGITTDQPPITEPNGKWFETIEPGKLVPQNLHKAQLERRLGMTEKRK